MSEPVHLADLLAALSVATDHAMGQEPEKAIRATVLAIGIADHLGIPTTDAGDVYFATLLKHIGCTATAHEESVLFGPDEAGMRAVAERTDDTDLREMLAFFGAVGRGSGLARVGTIARALTSGNKESRRIFRAVCEVGARMAVRLGLGPGVERALGETTERWDGKGGPRGIAGDDLSLVARIAEPATQAVIFHRLGGIDAVDAMARRRAGGMFDPAVAEALRAVAPEVLPRLDEHDPWEAVLAVEPAPARTIDADGIGRLAQAFADMIDLKSVYTLGHSAGVAELAGGAARRLGLDDPGTIHVAALLHDIGRMSVATGVWEKRGALSMRERELVRLHAYHSERILARSPALANVAAIAGMHHERNDGSGYHRAAPASATPPAARLLAVADAFQAMTQERPHRPGRSPSEAAGVVMAEVEASRFDPECARAVLEVAGTPPAHARDPWPAGLSEREVEVLRLMSSGLTNREIAASLVVSPRTAEHHVQHIYAKIGVSTRAAAAMFAMEHGLLR